METDHHSGSSDSETTDDEELRTTLPQQRQSTSPLVAVVQAPRPPNNHSEPIPANPLNTHGEHAEPIRDDGMPRALVLHHRGTAPCHARRETPKRQRKALLLPRYYQSS